MGSEGVRGVMGMDGGRDRVRIERVYNKGSE